MRHGRLRRSAKASRSSSLVRYALDALVPESLEDVLEREDAQRERVADPAPQLPRPRPVRLNPVQFWFMSPELPLPTDEKFRFLRNIIRPDRRAARREGLHHPTGCHDPLPRRCVEHKLAPLILDALLLTHRSESDCHPGSLPADIPS